MIKNILLETQAELEKTTMQVAAIKALLKQCEAFRFKSDAINKKFFNTFFGSDFEKVEMNFSQWSTIYRELVMDNEFLKLLGLFMLSYNDKNIKIFQNYMNKFTEEYNEEEDKAILINKANTVAKTISDQIVSIINTMLAQLANALPLIEYKKTLIVTFNDFIMSNIKLLDEYLNKSKINESITVDPEEEAELTVIQEVKTYLKSIDEKTFSLTEGVADAINDKKVQLKKFEDMIDERINKKLTQIRQDRQRKRHEQMVEQSLAISNEIKRILKFLPVALINPGIAGLGYIVSIIIDKRTRKQDKAVLMADIKLEIRIIDEKISIAERNGHDKEKIQLIRAKDKLERELERIDRA